MVGRKFYDRIKSATGATQELVDEQTETVIMMQDVVEKV